MSPPYSLLSIGGGPAGLAAARAYREAGGGGGVAIVTDEQRMPYNRPPLTKELLRGESDESDLPIEPETWLSEHRVDLIGGYAVALDAEERTVTLSGGRQLPYESCLLATGAEPVRLPIPGADDPAVHVVRTLDQVHRLLARLRDGAPVAVIGSGFIGCEIAASLSLRGQTVTMISSERAPNDERLGARAADEIAGWLHAQGVVLHADQEVRRIERDGERLTVVSQDCVSTATVVVMATGVAPRGELAAAAGVVMQGGAVPVDAAMRTTVAGLLAAGDVCLAENLSAGRALRVEHWGDALGQGAVAGRTAAGAEAAWDEVPGFWSTIGSQTLKYAAWGDGFETSRFEPGPDGSFVVRYGRDGTLVGVLTHRADDEYDAGGEAIRRGDAWPT